MQRAHEKDRGGSAPRSGHSQGSAVAASYVCEDCSKRYAVVPGEHDGAGALRCSCGGDLVAERLAPGVYELDDADDAPTRRKEPQASGDAMSREADLGYNESHGYGPAHGGPTGPGDAPALDKGGASTPPAAKKDDDDEEMLARGDA